MKKYLVPMSIVAVVFLILGLWTYARAVDGEITICVKNNGTVHVIGSEFKRDDCRKNETLLSWNITGSQGLKGDKGDKGDPGDRGPAGQSLHLFDANNQDLGILVSRSSTFLPTLGVVADFDLGDGTFRPTIADLFYEQPDCQGTAFISPSRVSGISTIDLENLYRAPADPREHTPTYRIVRSALPSYRDYFSKSNFQGPTSPSPCVSFVGGVPRSTVLIAVEEVTLPFAEPLAPPLEIR